MTKPLSSELSSQLELEKERASSGDGGKPRTSPPRPRPWSSVELKPRLSPSPAFLEPSKISKDDTCVTANPVTPKRPSIYARGLSLQMPPRDVSSSSTANFTTQLINRGPLSPKLDPSTSYGTASVLPRRSRGMDFSRACTNLHHSTLAEQSSPDSSPTIGGRAMLIPPRKGLYPSSMSSVPDSPGSAANSLWSTMAMPDKTAISSSVGSVNMMDSESGSTSSEDDAMIVQAEDEDTIHGTPQAGSSRRGPFGPALISSPGMDGSGPFSPSVATFMKLQRSRLKHGRSRKSSSSISGRSSMASPGPVSPLLKSVEIGSGYGYFPFELDRQDMASRRQSLSLGTGDLHISDGNDSEEGDASRISPHDALGIPIPVTPNPNLDERRNVIRRAVTRRGGNLLPKPKNFARIRAALQEEVSPIDTEVKREAEVIRQVRESDNDVETSLLRSLPNTAAPSPSLPAATAGPMDSLDDIAPDEMLSGDYSMGRRSSNTFTHQVMRNSAGLEFWNNFDERMRTPPPMSFARRSSSSISEDMSIDTPASSVLTMTPHQNNHALAQYLSRSRSCTPQPPPATVVEVTRKLGKRRRDDDLDPNFFKRRAVSPGVSVQNSPILPSSPAQKENGWWATQAKANREVPSGHVAGERLNGGSISNQGGLGPPKRVGLQGMNDTNDGLMNMSIE